MRAFVTAVFAFLYLPIGLLVLFSFNAGRNASEIVGFSTKWYGTALANPFLTEALRNSLIVASSSALLAAVPGVVIGIATLVALVQVFAFANPLLAAIWPGETPPRLGLGYGSIIAAHGLFAMALVTMIVRARLGVPCSRSRGSLPISEPGGPGQPGPWAIRTS